MPENFNTASSGVAEQKAALRKILLARRQGAFASGPAAEAAAAALARNFPEELIPAPGAVVAAYVPFRAEIDPGPLLTRLEGHGCLTALPRTPAKGEGLPLGFHLAPPLTVMERSPFGVLEPPAGAPVVVPDLVITPLLGFDAEGFRIGYGQGHYDRTLMALRARRPVVAVGCAWACQQVDRIPTDSFDQTLDWVVTEQAALGPFR